MEEKYASGVKFGKVNVDEVRDVARAASISAMPTFKAYINGARSHLSKDGPKRPCARWSTTPLPKQRATNFRSLILI